MVRVIAASEGMVSYGTLVAVAGLVMIASIVFAAPGALMVIIGAVMVTLGLIGRAGAWLAHSPSRLEESSGERSVAPGAAAS